VHQFVGIIRSTCKGLIVETYLEYASIGGTTILKWVLNKQKVMMCAGFVWVRTEISSEHLETL